MTSDTTTSVPDVAVVALMVAGTLLVLALFLGFVVLFPTLRRILRNVEKASGNAAETWENLAEMSTSAKEAAADLARLARTAADSAPHIVAKTQEITENVRVATARVAEASKLLGFIGTTQDAAGQSWAALGQFFKKLLGR